MFKKTGFYIVGTCLMVYENTVLLLKHMEQMQTDIGKIKYVIARAPGQDTDSTKLFEPTRFDSTDQFEEFTKKLEDDRSFYDVFVSL